jgi:hypothetical protein
MSISNKKLVTEKLTPAQAYFIACDKKYMWFCAGRGCFLKDTEVRMLDGSTKFIQDIVVGDLVMGDDKTMRQVLDLTTGRDNAYRILLEDGSYYDCNEGHDCAVVDEQDQIIKRVTLLDLLKNTERYRQIRILNGTPEKFRFTIEYLGIHNYYGFKLTGNNLFLLKNNIISANSGKTFIGARWIYKNVVRYPKSRGLICANWYHQLHSATLPPVLTYFRKIGLDFRINKRPPEKWLERTNFEASDYKGILTVETGCHIFLRSLDKPDGIRGIEFGWAWVDEIASSTKEAWDIVVGGLRDKESDELHIRVTGTPYGANWTWEEFKKKWDHDPDVSSEYDIVFMSTRDNSELPEGYLKGLLATYDKRTALQEIDGRILADDESRWYYEWNPDIHKRIAVPYDPNKALITCWDFNSTKESPMSMVVCQKHNFSDGTDFVQVIDEITIPSGNTPMVCQKFIDRYYPKHQAPVYVYGDRTGNTSTTGTTDYKQIEEWLKPKFPALELRTTRSNMTVKARQAAVNGLFCNSYGQVRLFVNPGCVELCLDLEKVQPDRFGGIDKSDPARSHTSDALGYFIAREFPVVLKTQAGVKQMGAINLGMR